MFTGIIESLGKVESLQNVGGDVRLRIQTDLDMSDVHLGDSIATNGICLTVIEWGSDWYAADVSRESLNRTTLGQWRVGQPVNVEKAKYLAEKGSITVDGISLTINHLRGNILSLNLIPHTAERTNISTWKTGAKVNLEVDVLARYIERLLLGDKAAEQGQQSADISMAFLAENGFLK